MAAVHVPWNFISYTAASFDDARAFAHAVIAIRAIPNHFILFPLIVGLEAVTSFSREFNDTWETFSIEQEQVSDIEDTVVILGRVKARGKASGVALETPVAYVHTLREGKLARTQVFFDHADAIEAAGLARRVQEY